MRRILAVAVLGSLAACLWFIGGTRSTVSFLSGFHVSADASPFTDFHGEMPGRVHKITVNDLPAPFSTKSSTNGPDIVARPANAWPQVPAGFKIDLFAADLHNPRLIQKAPNGDMFVAESAAGQIRIFRGIEDGKPETTSVFASGLNRPFGINFYPPGPNPQYVYIGNTDSVVRFPYKNGDLKATGAPQTIVPNLPTGGHWTRNVAFTPDGKQMYIAVGSRANIANTDEDKNEFRRANVLECNPDGSNLHVYASGIRNPVGMAIDPTTGELWVSVNERDAIGDNLPPDYITHVQENGFYGWPWYYTGGHEDPRLAGKHPELKGKAIVPDVLLEPHNASLELTFYEAQQFPPQFRGSIFASEHGSWNRSVRTGYEVIFVPVKDGHAAGEYEDFVTGFVTPDGEVWGRPVGVAAASDGSLMITDDGSNSIWRVTYVGQ